MLKRKASLYQDQYAHLPLDQIKYNIDCLIKKLEKNKHTISQSQTFIEEGKIRVPLVYKSLLWKIIGFSLFTAIGLVSLLQLV